MIHPTTKTKTCAHCHRRRRRKYIEWHPGIDEWQCCDITDCDDAVVRYLIKRAAGSKQVVVDYTNWRKERGKRKIVPISIRFGRSEYHMREQWLLKALDLKTNVVKEFSMRDIHSWRNR